ncbi:unnamed protein product, partial [Citrullus colocynthis]
RVIEDYHDLLLIDNGSGLSSNLENELHHFGWNSCSSCHEDASTDRRFRVLPNSLLLLSMTIAIYPYPILRIHHFGWNSCSSCHEDPYTGRCFLILPNSLLLLSRTIAIYHDSSK